jgi:hypothetical protein
VVVAQAEQVETLQQALAVSEGLAHLLTLTGALLQQLVKMFLELFITVAEVLEVHIIMLSVLVPEGSAVVAETLLETQILVAVDQTVMAEGQA